MSFSLSILGEAFFSVNPWQAFTSKKMAVLYKSCSSIRRNVSIPNINTEFLLENVVVSFRNDEVRRLWSRKMGIEEQALLGNLFYI